MKLCFTVTSIERFGQRVFDGKEGEICKEQSDFALTNDLKKACQGKYIERYTKDIGEHFFIYTKK